LIGVVAAPVFLGLEGRDGGGEEEERERFAARRLEWRLAARLPGKEIVSRFGETIARFRLRTIVPREGAGDEGRLPF